MSRDLKKDKFPNGALVYVIDYSTSKRESYKIGKSDDMNKRKQIYDTHMLHNKPVPYYVEFRCPMALETCIRGLLYEYRYKDRKDFYMCSLKKVKAAFASCLKGAKKVNCPNKSGSKTSKKNQSGGFLIPSTNGFTVNIKKLISRCDILENKINRLMNKIYNK